MIFNKPDGEHLLNVTNVESCFQNRSNNTIQEHSELLRKHKEFFLIILYVSEIVLGKAMIYENIIIH